MRSKIFVLFTVLFVFLVIHGKNNQSNGHLDPGFGIVDISRGYSFTFDLRKQIIHDKNSMFFERIIFYRIYYLPRISQEKR